MFESGAAMRGQFSSLIDALKNPANLAVGRAGPHGDCGLRDSVARRLVVCDRVQLFYLGTRDFVWYRLSFNFRFFLAEPDKQIFFFFWA
jgi:hypothetical protein